MWLIVAGGIVAAFAAASLWLARLRKLEWKSWLGAAVLVGWVVGVVIKVHFDQASAAAATAAAIAWPATTTAAPVLEPAAEPAAGSQQANVAQVGSVESMIGGLEKRLEQKPDDPNGWALLAQSYAFIGNSAGAQKAVAKAVALGVDEKTLRERVNRAKHDPHDAAAGSGG